MATTLLGAASSAQAAFITIDSVAPADSTIGVVSNNDFSVDLASLGVTTYTLGASLGVGEWGHVTYYYYGKEAGYRNDFSTESLFYSSGYSPSSQNLFGAPALIGTEEVHEGRLNFGFCAYGAGLSLQGCVSNAQNDALGYSSNQSIAMYLSGNTAWLFWDDSGAGPDDNHDDMLIKAVFTPSTSVPEPGALALLGIGLLGAGLATRRRRS